MAFWQFAKIWQEPDFHCTWKVVVYGWSRIQSQALVQPYQEMCRASSVSDKLHPETSYRWLYPSRQIEGQVYNNNSCPFCCRLNVAVVDDRCCRLFRWRSWWKVDSRTTLSSCSGSRSSMMPTSCRDKSTTPPQREDTSRSEVELRPVVRQRNRVRPAEVWDRRWRLLRRSQAAARRRPTDQARSVWWKSRLSCCRLCWIAVHLFLCLPRWCDAVH